MRLRGYGETHRGCLSNDNQDAIHVSPCKTLFAVADGIGSLPEGAQASSIALEVLAEHHALGMAITLDHWRSCVARINQRLWAHSLQRGLPQACGTTLTALLCQGDRAWLLHVGDSLLLRVRDGQCVRLSEEHTVAAALRAAGASHAVEGRLAHTLTRCLGPQEIVEAQFQPVELRSGDRLILCTDGLTAALDGAEVLQLMEGCPAPEAAVAAWMDRALERGAPDNLSAIALFCD